MAASIQDVNTAYNLIGLKIYAFYNFALLSFAIFNCHRILVVMITYTFIYLRTLFIRKTLRLK